MRNYHKILFILGLQLFSVACYAGTVNVNSLSFGSAAQKSRIAFTVTASPKHRVFVLANPSRLVIDIKNAKLAHGLTQPSSIHPLFARVRSATKNATDLRVVVDLKKKISPETFFLSTNNKDGQHLIVDLVHKTLSFAAADIAPEIKTKSPVVPKEIVAVQKPRQETLEKTTSKGLMPVAEADTRKRSGQLARETKDKTFVIALDAGHGGDDPGAHGPQGTEEKVVTYAIAKKLAALINEQPNMKAIMIRKGDYYIDLRKRMQLARAAKADLFISIHADAFKDASVRGASVYTLSTRGASSEAAHWLADSENASEVGGVSLHDKEDVLASVLLDLSQTATQQSSNDVAKSVLKNFQNISVLHKDSVQKAGFIVLKSPDIPSILVETAFISNPLEEQNLTSVTYQAKMASAIFNGVHHYFKKSTQTESRLAAL
jgi:N-acetylmuramoyl-L-alanine amidase